MVSKTGHDTKDGAQRAAGTPVQANRANGDPAEVGVTPATPDQPEPRAANPLTTLILTDIAMSAGSAMLARTLGGRGLAGRVLSRALPTRSPGGLIRAPSLAGSLVGTAIARIATRSVPGAIVVGGGLVAKALYEKRKAKRLQQGKTPKR